MLGPALGGYRPGQEVSFSIKKSFGSRKGWKIMPDDGQQNIDSSALQSVVSIIKDMEIKVTSLALIMNWTETGVSLGMSQVSSIAGVCSSRTD